MDLKTPSKKGFKAPSYHCPLPICNESSSTICSDEYDWPIFTGQYNGTSVIIDEPSEIIALSKKGYFGKGSLSKGCPNTGKRKVHLNVLSESQWKRRKHWMETLTSMCKDFSVDSSSGETEAIKECDIENSDKKDSEEKMDVDLDIKSTKESVSNEKINKEFKENEAPLEKSDIDNQSANGSSVGVSSDNSKTETESRSISVPQKSSHVKGSFSSNCTKLLDANEVLVIADLENNLEGSLMNLNPHIEKENIKTVIEVLYLSLEEAFFLSYALNCLQIVDLTSNFLSIKEMWVLFQQSQADFIEKYVAYHHFRAKGWVVKSGIKFGGDFLLYKKGPQYYHASYIVLVQALNPDGSKRNDNNSMTWKKVVAMNRMAESATKEILICQVMKPDCPADMFNEPTILKEYRVGELLLRRWQATQEKE